MASKKDNIVDFSRGRQETREQVLERLFNHHGAPLRSFVRGRLGTDEDSEDIVQEVFARLAIMDGLKTKLSEKESRNRAYMFTVANNLIVDNERRKLLQKSYQAQLNTKKVQEVTPEQIVSAERQLSILKRAILEMRPTWRQAFVLNRFKFMSYSQIAVHMGVTLKQVENYMAQALVRVRDIQRVMKGSRTDIKE